jgi:[ribosomal protein S5]-alanine N-acetyltransferase
MPNEIMTTRLRLRTVEMSDLNSIHHLLSLPETDRYNTQGIPEDITETQRIVLSWIEDHQKQDFKLFPFAVGLAGTGESIGLISLRLGHPKYKRAEVSYKIFPAHWGKGYATEALNGLLDFGFNKLALHRIHAGCAVDNVGSIRVLEKCGMQLEGRMRQILPLKNGWSDNFEFGILDTDPRFSH